MPNLVPLHDSRFDPPPSVLVWDVRVDAPWCPLHDEAADVCDCQDAACVADGHDDEAARVGYMLAWECKRCGRLDVTNVDLRATIVVSA